MKRNEVISELMKLRKRCTHLKCSPTGKPEELVRAEEALHYAIYALIWGCAPAGEKEEDKKEADEE